MVRYGNNRRAAGRRRHSQRRSHPQVAPARECRRGGACRVLQRLVRQKPPLPLPWRASCRRVSGRASLCRRRRGALLGVATDEEGQERIVAVAEYAPLRDAKSAEVAFAVADELQGRGIGTRLLERLAVLAAAQGGGADRSSPPPRPPGRRQPRSRRTRPEPGDRLDRPLTGRRRPRSRAERAGHPDSQELVAVPTAVVTRSGRARPRAMVAAPSRTQARPNAAARR